MTRQSINEAVSVSSLLVSAISGIVGVWHCPTASWYRWVAVGFLFVFGISAFLALMQSRWALFGGFKEVANQHFQNQDILLDGHQYIACQFTNVTFVYNGGKSGGFDTSCIVKNPAFRTGDPKMGQMLAFLHNLRLMREDSVGRYTPKL